MTKKEITLSFIGNSLLPIFILIAIIVTGFVMYDGFEPEFYKQCFFWSSIICGISVTGFIVIGGRTIESWAIALCITLVVGVFFGSVAIVVVLIRAIVYIFITIYRYRKWRNYRGLDLSEYNLSEFEGISE